MQEAHKETSEALPSGEEESDAQKKATVVITREAQLKDEKIAYILRVSTDPKGDEKTITHAEEQMAEEYARMAGKLSTGKLVSKPSVAAKSGQTQPPPVSHAGADEESVEDDDDEVPRVMPSAGPPPGPMAAELNPPDVSVPDVLPLVEKASAPTAAAPDMATAEDEQNIPVGSEQNIQDEPEQIIPEEPELTVPDEPEQSVLADAESANSGPPRITQSEVPVQNPRRSTRARRPPQRLYDEELSRIYRSAYASWHYLAWSKHREGRGDVTTIG